MSVNIPEPSAHKNEALKKHAIIGAIALGVLFILSIIYYKERVLFMDGAFYLFTILDGHTVYHASGRYGSYLTQAVPLIGQKLNLPVKVLMILYGMSFYLFFLTVCLLLVFRFKQYRLAILMALFYFLFVSISYIWINEIYQAVAWMFLFLGSTLYMGKKQASCWCFIMTFLLLAFITLYTHMIVAIPTLFLWTYLILDRKNWPFNTKKTIVLSLLLIGIIVTKYVTSSSDPDSAYDAGNLQGVSNISFKTVMESLNTPVIQVFLYRCATNYWVGVLVFIAGIINLVRQKRIGMLIVTLLTVFIYFALMAITYGRFDANFNFFHIECEWVSMGIIAAAPWVFTYDPEHKPVIVAWSLAGVFAVRFVYITYTLPRFTKRVQLTENVLAKMREKKIPKLAIYATDELNSIVMDRWALSLESLLLSKAEHDEPQLSYTLVNKDDSSRQHTLSTSNGLDLIWGFKTPEQVNAPFIINKDAMYTIMSYEDLMKK